MCGIFGILSVKKENLTTKILDGLYQLQNRGYDSAGHCHIVTNDAGEFPQFFLQKYASTLAISALDRLRFEIPQHTYNVGVGHNRWATHGMKTDANAHPHLSTNKIFSIVHNGIIENFHELRSFFNNKPNYVFYSQTDTEIIANLIEYFYFEAITASPLNVDMVSLAIQRAISMLQGTYGLIIQCVYFPDVVYCIRNGSPILIGYADDYAIITSETAGFCNLVSNYFILHNDDLCCISLTQERTISIKTVSSYSILSLKNQQYLSSPEPFSHWTLKEIYEQPKCVLHALNNGGRISNDIVKLGGLESKKKYLVDIDHIILLGCGTSFFSASYGAFFFKSLCKNYKTVQVFDGADFNENLDLPRGGGKTAFILVSQSGETRDLHRCIEIAKNNNIITIGIINTVDSLIAREVDCGVYCNAGKEVAVASTKAFTSQVVCLSLTAIWFSQLTENGVCNVKRKTMIQDLHTLSNDLQKTIQICEGFIRGICEKKMADKMFVLGKGCDEFIAREGALKIKEMSYIHAEGYSASSLKHGPFALLDSNFPCILLNLEQQYNSKIINTYEEILSRGSSVLFITSSKSVCMKYQDQSQLMCLIPENKTYGSLLGIIPLQLIAYYASIMRGINPDQPKNLAKVVTVD